MICSCNTGGLTYSRCVSILTELTEQSGYLGSVLWCVVPIGIGRGSSSRDRQRRLLTHTHWALYRLTPFHTYLALTDRLLAAPPLSPVPFSPPSLHLANSHFSPSLTDSPRLYSPSRVSLTHVLLLLLLSLLQTWHKAANRSNITLTFLPAVPLPLQGLNVASIYLSPH